MITRTQKPSNLLVIMSDEHRRDAMGCSGHPQVKTPNIDQLATRGTRFNNAYTPSPMCVPTRAAVACGNYINRIGYWDSATPYDGRHRSWMHQLRDQGIPVTSIGKLHFRSAEDDNGFTEELLPMHVVGGVGWAVGLLRKNPPAYESASELAADVGIGTSSYTDYDLHITDAATRWIESRPTVASDTPWAAFVSLVSPHYPLTCPAEYMQMYDPGSIELPVGYENRGDPTHPELKQIRRFFDYDAYFDESTMRTAKAAYYGLTSFMDDCIGRILSALDNSGQAENTVVIYTSDHGDMLGDQGYWTKQVMYEQSAGVPLIAAGPGFKAGHMVGTAVSLTDIAATAMDICGATHDEHSVSLPGQSLRLIADAPDDPERTVLSEYHDGGSTTGTFMVRWQHWKYVHYVGVEPQLFNLSNDPHELVNLAASESECSTIRPALQEGERRLRNFCDPDEVNNRCFAEQAKRIEQLGGSEACRDAFVFNHTPVPSIDQQPARD